MHLAATSRKATILRSDLRACMLDGLYYAIMVGLAEVYIAPFTLRLGLGPVAAGLITTLPALIGALLQLKAPALIRRIGSFPRFMYWCAMGQALMYLPLAACAVAGPWLVPWFREHSSIHLLTASVFVIWMAYWTFGAAAGPAWQTTVGAIIPPKVRVGYFAKRSRILHVATLLSILFQGVLITHLVSPIDAQQHVAATPTESPTFDPILLVYAGLFIIACGFRIASAYHLGKYSEPIISPRQERRIHPFDAVKRMKHSPDGRYLLYALSLYTTAMISGPYFNPFMVDILKADQRPMFEAAPWLGPALSWLLAGAILGRIIALPTVGALARRFGPRKVLAVSGLLVVPGSLFWLTTTSPILLLVGQITFGIVWAGIELSMFLLNYVMLKPEERTSMLTLFAAGNELGKSGGSLAGAGLFLAAGESRAAYAMVFWVSTAARICTIPLLMRLREPDHDLPTVSVINPGPPAAMPGERLILLEPRQSQTQHSTPSNVHKPL